MSKSLGNVLDPFEVIDELRHRRAALLPDARRRRSAATARVGIDAVRARYDAELANEYGNLASRTIAMLERYRDGVVPAGRAPTRRCAADVRGARSTSVAALLDRAEVTQALELIWQRVRRLNRYVEERAPWQLARDPDARRRARRDARVAGRGRAGRERAAAPVHAGGDARSCSTRSALRGSTIPARRSRRRRRVARSARSSRCSRSVVIDSHTHLELCEPPDAELVAAADEAGVTRIVTVGTDGASCRAALAAAEDFPQVYAAIGRHPNSATGFDDADLAELEALAAHEVRGDRRDRARLLPRLRAARRPGARVPAPRSSWRARPASRW